MYKCKKWNYFQSVITMYVTINVIAIIIFVTADSNPIFVQTVANIKYWIIIAVAMDIRFSMCSNIRNFI